MNDTHLEITCTRWRHDSVAEVDLNSAIAIADELQTQFGLSTEVIDMRAAVPLNYSPLVEPVTESGKALLLSDAVERGSAMQTFAANLTQLFFDGLDAAAGCLGIAQIDDPRRRIGNPVLSRARVGVGCDPERILSLKNHGPGTKQGREELIRGAKAGI